MFDPPQVDLATMTGNVAQVFLTDGGWTTTLRAIGGALHGGGHLVFETRDPARRAWQEWDRDTTWSQIDVPAVGLVTTWCDVLEVHEDPDPLVTFRWTYVFDSDGAVLTSDSTLRFRSPGAIGGSLAAAGYVVEDVRDAPDRPGRELVFVARRPPEHLRLGC